MIQGSQFPEGPVLAERTPLFHKVDRLAGCLHGKHSGLQAGGVVAIDAVLNLVLQAYG